MAILLQNNLDVGPAATTISVTNSDDNGDDPFDVVDSSGSGAVCRYVDAVNRPTAAFVAEFATGNSSRSPSCEWTTALGQQTHFWTRFYIRYNTNPTFNSPFLVTSQGATLISSIGITGTTPYYYMVKDEIEGFADTFHPAGPTSPGVTLTLGEWVRIEAEFLLASGLWYVNGSILTGDQVDEDEPGTQATVSNSVPTGLAYVDTIAVGCPVAAAHYEAVQISGLAVSLDGPIGPGPRQRKGWPNIQPRTLAARHDSSW